MPMPLIYDVASTIEHRHDDVHENHIVGQTRFLDLSNGFCPVLGFVDALEIKIL